MFIYNIGIPKHKNTYDFFVQIRNFFYYLWVKKFFDIRREAQSFYADFSICPHSRVAPVAHKFVWPRPGLHLNSLIFLKSPKSSAHASGAWRHSHPWVTFSYLGFYFDIREWRVLPACAWTPALMLHLTNPCAKRKVLSLIKPKGKIYKTKSLGHYITKIRLGIQTS